MVFLEKIEQRVQAACEKAGRSRSEIELIAVTKKRPLEAVNELYTLGQRHMAENRVQDARKRLPELPRDICWHFIGHVQTNKTKYLPGLFDWVHSVDRLDLAEALQKTWEKKEVEKPLNILLQFNISGEDQKYGAETSEALDFLKATLEMQKLSVQGLMCMAPYSDDPETSRPVFKSLRRLRDELTEKTGHALPHLSMGMTNDFAVAIEEGATMVRIGTALFEEE